MRGTKFGVLGFVCLSVLLCGQAFAGDAELVEKLFARAAENAAKGTSLATVRFAGGETDDVLSFSWGVTNTATAGTGGGGGAGKATLSDFSFVKRLSKSSADLFRSCANGTHFKEVTVEARDSKGVKYMEIKFTDVMITSYQTGGSDGQELLDHISFAGANVDYILIGL
jgi:type VI protein secretion system component Hcp